MAPQKIRVKEPTRRAGGCWEGLPDEVKFKLRHGKTRGGEQGKVEEEHSGQRKCKREAGR